MYEDEYLDELDDELLDADCCYYYWIVCYFCCYFYCYLVVDVQEVVVVDQTDSPSG